MHGLLGANTRTAFLKKNNSKKRKHVGARAFFGERKKTAAGFSSSPLLSSRWVFWMSVWRLSERFDMAIPERQGK